MTTQTAYDPGLTGVDDDQLCCMAEGHDWPKLRLNRQVPRDIRVTPNRDGTYQLTYICRVCGTERTRTTLPQGEYDQGATYTYAYPGSWVHFTAGEDMTRARIKTELSKRAVGLFAKLGEE